MTKIWKKEFTEESEYPDYIEWLHNWLSQPIENLWIIEYPINYKDPTIGQISLILELSMDGVEIYSKENFYNKLKEERLPNPEDKKEENHIKKSQEND